VVITDLRSPKEVDISKLLHLVHIHSFHDFLIIKQDPRFLSYRLIRDVFSDEGDVVSISPLAQLQILKEGNTYPA
jgi:hypothetical protein